MNKQIPWIAALAVTLYSVAALAQQEEPSQISDATDISESLSTNSEPKTGEIRYVTDLIYTPIRTGPGGDYRIVNKGLPFRKPWYKNLLFLEFIIIYMSILLYFLFVDLTNFTI